MAITMLPITLILAGGLALINLWLTVRVGQVRRSEKISVGDGGNDRVIRRMRAHANFGENAPLVLALVGLIEFSSGTSIWLWIAAALFLVARIAHGLGMDEWRSGRAIGTTVTMVALLVLSVWAIAIPLVAHHETSRSDPLETVVPNG